MPDSKGPIVFPTDFSDLSHTAVPWARRMSAVMDGELHCLNVVTEPRIYAGMEFDLASMPTEEELVEEAQKRMGDFVSTEFPGQNVATRVLTGNPFVEIVRYARENNASMIIMSTHGFTGLKHALLGSTTEAVLRKADCPVLSIRNPEMRFEMP
jgi:nucleotide-binding universal stress UspA family protein